MNNALTNTRAGRITAPVDAELTVARMATLDDDGKAIYAEDGILGRFVVIECSDDTANLVPIEPAAQIRVTLSGTCDPGDGLKTGTDGVAVAASEGEAVSLVAEEAGIDGQDVLSRGPTGIPAYTPNELPAIEEGDAGKVLTVADDETGFELATPSGGLPDTGGADEEGFPIVADGEGGVRALDGNPVTVIGTLQLGQYSTTWMTSGRLAIVNDLDGAEVVVIEAGSGSGSANVVITDAANGLTLLQVSSNGSNAVIKMPSLPTSDPGDDTQLWNDNGTLKFGTPI